MKAKRSYPDKKFKFDKYQEIGSPDAETDRILEQAFIENDAFSAIVDMGNQRSILIGRTGSGKSAILKHIEFTQEKVVRIDPEAMSLRFLSNSTILQYFKEIDVNLNFFYKILWKHVFLIELIRLHFGYDNHKKNNWYLGIKDKLKRINNPKRNKALEYFDKWSSEFWIDAETRIKEIERTVQQKFETEVGVDVKVLRAKTNSNGSDISTVKSEIKTKAEHIITEALAHDIHEIINILKEEIFVDVQQKHFLIIDDLDKEWISTTMRYDLIGAMIEVIKEFQFFKGVKIVIALRDNLYQLLFTGAKHNGGQREKFKPLYAEIEWTSLELQELLNIRLQLVSGNILDTKNAFEKIYKTGKTGFEYMLERTFNRPRDVISFVNHAIENSKNKNSFSMDILKKAEVDYSVERLQAIEDEWGENYGDINKLTKFLYAKHNGFRLRNIKEDDFDTTYLEENPQTIFRGDLSNMVVKWQNNQFKFISFLKEVILILYGAGILGIKKGPTHPVQFFYDKNPILTVNDINNDCKIYVHKAFYSVFKINVKEQESEVY
ncbi:MAG: hypothetical protein V4553_16245 [Bacteroidota bacterium]